jgi:hypothetical protein
MLLVLPVVYVQALSIPSPLRMQVDVPVLLQFNYLLPAHQQLQLTQQQYQHVYRVVMEQQRQ